MEIIPGNLPQIDQPGKGIYNTRSYRMAPENKPTQELVESPAVTWRIRSAIAKIESSHPQLGAHLSNAIKTGSFVLIRPTETYMGYSLIGKSVSISREKYCLISDLLTFFRSVGVFF